MSPDLTPGGSYNDQASRLLADIADLLLGGPKDWNALERLQRALTPPKSGLTFPEGARDFDSGMADIMKTIYEKKIYEELAKTPITLSKDTMDSLTYGSSTDFNTDYITRASKKLDEMEVRRAQEKLAEDPLKKFAKFTKTVAPSTGNAATMGGVAYSYQWMDEIDKVRGVKVNGEEV